MKWKREQTTQNAVWHSGSTQAGWLPGRSAQAAQPRSIHARGSRWQTLTLMNSSAVFGTRKKAVRHFFSVVRPRNGTQKRADFVSMQIKLLLALAHRLPPIHRHMRDQRGGWCRMVEPTGTPTRAAQVHGLSLRDAGRECLLFCVLRQTIRTVRGTYNSSLAFATIDAPRVDNCFRGRTGPGRAGTSAQFSPGVMWNKVAMLATRRNANLLKVRMVLCLACVAPAGKWAGASHQHSC